MMMASHNELLKQHDVENFNICFGKGIRQLTSLTNAVHNLNRNSIYVLTCSNLFE